MLLAGRLLVQDLMKSLDFSVCIILSAAVMALWLTQPMTEMNTKILPGVEGCLAFKANNLTAICEPIF
jgi:hypothetical protein